MEAFRAVHAQRDLCLDLFFLHSVTVGGKFIIKKRTCSRTFPQLAPRVHWVQCVCSLQSWMERPSSLLLNNFSQYNIGN